LVVLLPDAPVGRALDLRQQHAAAPAVLYGCLHVPVAMARILHLGHQFGVMAPGHGQQQLGREKGHRLWPFWSGG
jgi:hypothetical protein